MKQTNVVNTEAKEEERKRGKKRRRKENKGEEKKIKEEEGKERKREEEKGKERKRKKMLKEGLKETQRFSFSQYWGSRLTLNKLFMLAQYPLLCSGCCWHAKVGLLPHLL